MATEAIATAAADGAPPDKIAGPPPPRYYDPQTWRLISQGAEARVWLVPNFVSVGSSLGLAAGEGRDSSPSTATSVAAVCKERFPKSYRHPDLDRSITRGRTKGEARCLVRCRRGGVPCPAVLGVDVAKNADDGGGAGGRLERSCCLFLEHIEGCTVREYFEARSDHAGDEVDEVERDREEADGEDKNDDDDDMEEAVGDGSANLPLVGDQGGGNEEVSSSEPGRKRARHNDSASGFKVKTTRVDAEAFLVARALGRIIADTHAAGIFHGDLTTSNVMLRNPPPLIPPTVEGGGGGPPAAGKPPSACPAAETAEKVGAVRLDEGGGGGGDNGEDSNWAPSLCLIDLGLSGTAGSKGTSVEEKAVDLYVMERAFDATHPGSRRLVEEMVSAYEERGNERDTRAEQTKKSKKGGKRQSVTAGVMSRLRAVRMRGRKRECFG